MGDESEPDISDVYYNPDNPSPGDPVTIYAYVYDSDSGIEEVTLSYSTDWGTSWNNVSMNKAGGDYWSAQVTIYDDEVTVYYKIYAKDNAGNWAVTEENNYYVVIC
jgi:hypothetical protein